MTFFEARQNVLACDGGISSQEVVDAVAVSKHADNLVHGNARASDTCLAVANRWVNGNAFAHGNNVPQNPRHSSAPRAPIIDRA
jgi:hypothetical protein